MHQVNISEPEAIICKHNEVLIPSLRMDTKGPPIRQYALICSMLDFINPDKNVLVYVWFLKNIKKRKKILKENGFLIFGFTIRKKKQM